MSKIGKLPVQIPNGVKVTINPTEVIVEGPKGKLSHNYDFNVKVDMKDGHVTVMPTNSSKTASAAHGLYRSLIHNMVVGVTTGFSKSLVITGVGYRAEVKGKVIVFNLGYSTEFFVDIPEGLSATADATGKVTVSGIDKQAVGEFCAQIRKLRKPEPYKGKGVRYDTEVIKRKVGKTGVK